MARRALLVGAALALALALAAVPARAEDAEAAADSDMFLSDENAADVDDAPAAVDAGVAQLATDDAPLIELSAKDFNATITHHSAILVEFFAPWCGTCKSVAAEYARAAALVRSHGLPVVLARVDVNAPGNTEWAQETMDIERVPTFTLYREHGAQQADFPLLTTAEAYVAGLGKMLGSELDLTPAKTFPPEEDAISVASWLFWRGSSDGKLLTTLMFYAPPEGDASLTPEAAAGVAAAFASFDAVAKELMRFSNLRFGIVRTPGVLAEFDIPADRASLVLYTEHDEGRFVYDGPAGDAAALRRWLLTLDVPLVTDVWHRTLQGLRRRVQTLAILYVPGPVSEHYASTARLRDGLQRVAYALEARGLVSRGNFSIAVADGTKYKSWMAHAGLPEGRLPAMAVEHTPSEEVVPLADFVAEASVGLAAHIARERAQAVAGAEADAQAGADSGVAAVMPPLALERVGSEYVLSPEAPEEEAAAVAALRGGAEGKAAVAVGTDGSAVAAPGSGSFEHTVDDRLPWMAVPEARLTELLAEYIASREARLTAKAYAAA